MAAKSFATYVKAAFKNHWNLLAIAAGTAFAFISGHPDIALPIVAAGELAYLAGTAGHPRFQHYVDKVQGKIQAKQANAASGQRFQELYDGLDEASRTIWDSLRAKCAALGAGAPTVGALDAIAAEQVAGVNKLLWVHLKLLHTRMKLGRFLAQTDEREMDRHAADAGKKLAALPAAATDPVSEKKRKSLEDLLATLKTRKDNLARARQNYELVELELGRISAKLQGVVELAANRHDPGSLTTEVDDAAASVAATEQMMGELAMFTGLTENDVEAPEILSVAQKAAIAGRVRAG
jgi:hypothetical protein